MKRVIIESPYAGQVERNLNYVRNCMRDCLLRGEAPFASHALYTQADVLNDDIPEERELGMRAGWEWVKMADLVAFYVDHGWSKGMLAGKNVALNFNKPFEERRLVPQSLGELEKP